MKLLVIGNCQARPVASLLAAGVKGTVLLDPIILHLASAKDAEKHLTDMEDADVILAQNTVDTFIPGHIATSKIRASFSDKIIVWPNVFYAGQQPYLRYVTHADRGRAMGPFDAYHDLRILSDWYTGKGVSPYWEGVDPKSISAASLAELRAKESNCDVFISDYVHERSANTPLFFTFNHPTLVLLEEICRRIAGAMSVVFEHSLSKLKEPLHRIIVPSTWSAGPRANWMLSGPRLDISSYPFVIPGPPMSYRFDEAYALSHQCYDKQEDLLLDLKKIRLTPNYRSEDTPP